MCDHSGDLWGPLCDCISPSPGRSGLTPGKRIGCGSGQRPYGGKHFWVGEIFYRVAIFFSWRRLAGAVAVDPSGVSPERPETDIIAKTVPESRRVGTVEPYVDN